jgi:hypothetical protein
MHTSLLSLLLVSTGAVAQVTLTVEPAGRAVTSAAAPSNAAANLIQQYGIKPSDWNKVTGGEIVTRVLDRHDNWELVLLGVVQLPGRPSDFAAFARQLEQFSNNRHVARMGQFASASLPQDLELLAVRQEDVKAVRSCRLGKCHMKLPSATIAALSQLDSDDELYEAQVSRIVVGWLGEYLQQYLAGGNAALVEYADQQEPQSLERGFRELLSRFTVLAEQAPELYDYLQQGPAETPSEIENQFYWLIEDFGMRPLTTVTQSTMYRAEPGELWIVLKQLYASHYLRGALRSLRVVAGPDTPEGPSSYLVCVERVLFDKRVGGLKRALVTPRMRGHLEDRLNWMRRILVQRGKMVASLG